MTNLLGLTATSFALFYWLKGQAEEGAKGWLASAAKTLSTAILAVIGWLNGIDPWITLGLAFGALGDFALTRNGKRAFMAGLIAFAIGHLAYIAGFLTGFGELARPGPLLIVIALLPLSTFVWLLPYTGALRGPVFAYCVIIAATAAAAALLVQAPLIWWGVAAFVMSDILLALRLFRLQSAKARKAAALTLWPLYFGGQALILAGAL